MFLVMIQSPNLEATLSLSSTSKHSDGLQKYLNVFLENSTMCSILSLESLSSDVQLVFVLKLEISYAIAKKKNIFSLSSYGKNLSSMKTSCRPRIYKVSLYIFFFERSHPVVYHQIHIILVPSIHDTCKDQMFYYSWVILGDMFRPLNGHLQANIYQYCYGTVKIVVQLDPIVYIKI